MCDPVTIGAMALGGVGAAINGSEASANARRQTEARNAATQAELARQKGFQGESNGIFNTSLGAFSPETQAARLAAAKSGATTFFNANQPLNVGSIGTNNASAASKAGAERTVADVFANNADKSANLGALTGWDQYGFDNKVGLADSARKLGTISDLARNSASVGGLEQQVNYNNAYKPPSGFGDLLMFAGNVLPTTMKTTSLFKPGGVPLAGSTPLGQGGIGHPV